MKYIILFFLLLPEILISQSDSLLEKNPPDLVHYITDETGTLSKEQMLKIDDKLWSFADSTSTQIVVYMISSLKGEVLEKVSYAIATKNKIGTTENNGILVFIVKDDKKMRLEIGYGLEGIIPDAKASRIINDFFIPDFAKGFYFRGISRGIDEIIRVVKYEKFDLSKKNNEFNHTKDVLTGMLWLFGGFSVMFLILYLINRFTGGVSVSSKGSYSSSSTAYRSYSSGSSSGSYSGSSSGKSFSGGGGKFGGGGASGSW